MWEAIDQRVIKRKSPPADVKLSLIRYRQEQPFLSVTISAEVAAKLGWRLGTTVGLQVGRGDMAGWVRIFGKAGGRQFRKVPMADRLNVLLTPPEDMAAFKAESLPALSWKIDGPGVLLAELPWDLTGDPAAEAPMQKAA